MASEQLHHIARTGKLHNFVNIRENPQHKKSQKHHGPSSNTNIKSGNYKFGIASKTSSNEITKHFLFQSTTTTTPTTTKNNNKVTEHSFRKRWSREKPKARISSHITRMGVTATTKTTAMDSTSTKNQISKKQQKSKWFQKHRWKIDGKHRINNEGENIYNNATANNNENEEFYFIHYHESLDESDYYCNTRTTKRNRKPTTQQTTTTGEKQISKILCENNNNNNKNNQKQTCSFKPFFTQNYNIDKFSTNENNNSNKINKNTKYSNQCSKNHKQKNTKKCCQCDKNKINDFNNDEKLDEAKTEMVEGGASWKWLGANTFHKKIHAIKRCFTEGDGDKNSSSMCIERRRCWWRQNGADSKQNIFLSSSSTATSLPQWRHSRNNILKILFQHLLPILLLFNTLPCISTVASNDDTTLARGPSPSESRPWIPVVAYVEPLPNTTKAPKCDQTFVSRSGGPSNGTFTAPTLQNPANHSRQCLYIFLAGPGQRVEVVFTSFNLRGNPPDGAAVGELPACVHEYMDIYAEVQSSDPADLINSPFGGRYCGPIAPRRRISLFRALALSFFTIKNQTSPELFSGRYAFINESEYEVGTPVVASPCSYTVNFAVNRTGNIISPTYPGAYPKDMSCTYQFIGKSSQRVRIEFRDFDLFFGGPHCPFDFVKVYDGPDNSSGLIGTYCGQQRNLVLYSSESSLFIHFNTLQRTANTQNRGFKGIYEFSESFVKLDFIRENAGEHIRGSECDQKILSKKKSFGFVYSPNYPFPYMPKVVCRYFIYGMQDAQHLERVKIEFSMIEIPKGTAKAETNCSDGYLKIYLKGQETTDSYDKFDHELCDTIQQFAVVSDGPRLVMVFSSGDALGRGFKGKYSFETEYKIPGTAAPDGTCSFLYKSTSRKRGEFNSPRYPSNYPSEMNCSYVFQATPNEQVVIVFDHFKVKANTSGSAYGSKACFEDWIEIFIMYRDGHERLLGRYCGLTSPGPVESPSGANGIRIILHTDSENVASGFKARYIFEAAKGVFGDCGGNYSGKYSGTILSPNFPATYEGPGKGLSSKTCNWYITARLGYKLLVNFDYFSVEGDPPSRGCPAAVVRLWTSLETETAPLEICGEKAPADDWHHVSTGQSVRISFTTADKAIGAQGFRIVWTEIQDSAPGQPTSLSVMCESTYHFHCLTSGYCIADKLKCDGIKNCGPGDDSDEKHCLIEVPEENHGVLIVISSLIGVLFLICLLCILCHRKKKRRHHRQLGLHRNAAHYDSTTSATGLGSSRRHLQSGGSLSGSFHGLHADSLPIPPAPLPPTSIPPHICISGSIMDDDDDDDDDDDEDEDNCDDDNMQDQDHEHEHSHHDHDHDHDLFVNSDRFSNGDSV